MRAMKVELLHGADATAAGGTGTIREDIFWIGSVYRGGAIAGGRLFDGGGADRSADASDASVITAGFALALASFLLVYFV